MQPERKDIHRGKSRAHPPSPILYSKQIPEVEVLKKFCASGSA
jgi:hypothetical protein